MAVTIGTNGEARPDQYWLLKSDAANKRTITEGDGVKGYVVPVHLEACDLETYQSSPAYEKRLLTLGMWRQYIGDKTHGRRINDEVELYEMGESGEETPGLREGMEEMGLTVRSYVQQSPTSKYPSRASVFKQEKSFMDTCRQTLVVNINKHAELIGEPIGCAVLADPGNDDKRFKQQLLVVIVHQAYFEILVKGKEEYITTNGVRYNIIGYYHEEASTFIPDDEVAKKFFTKGGKHVMLSFFDHAKRLDDEAAEAMRQDKKAAKKIKRAANLGTDSERGESGEDDAVDKAQAKREKEKAKKKAYVARRKARVEEEAKAEKEAKAEEGKQAITLARVVDGEAIPERPIILILHPNEDNPTRRQLDRRGSASEVVSDDSDDDDAGPGTGSSSSESSEDTNPDGNGMKVVKVTDLASAKKVLKANKGTIMVMSQEELDEVAVEVTPK